MMTSPFAATGPLPQSWRDYWGADALWRESPLGRAAATALLRRLPACFPLDTTDSVLEIGCGPGHLAELCAPLVARVHAVDVSPAAVEACRARCQGLGNVTTGLLREDYTDLGPCGGPFTRILCVSVVQYYRDIDEALRLVRSARAVAAPGARMLIADLPLARGPAGFAWDALGSLLGAMRGGYLAPLLRAARGRWSKTSPYRAFHDRAGSLTFTRDAIAQFARATGLPATTVRGSLSVYANRPSLVLEL